MARKTLDEILDSDEPVGSTNHEEVFDDEQAGEQPPEPEAKAEPLRDENGKFAKKGVEPEPEPEEAKEPEAVPPTADKLPEDVYKPLKAVRDENKTLKDQLEALQKEIRQQQQPKEPEKPAPSIWEDDQAWQEHFGGQLVNQSVQQSVYQARLQMSEMLMAEQHEDFADIKQQLVEFVGANPTINQHVAESSHPWRTAYQAFKNQRTMQELGAVDVDSLRNKLREEILAELQAQTPATPNVPKSLSTKRSVGSRSGPSWSGPTSLDELLS